MNWVTPQRVSAFSGVEHYGDAAAVQSLVTKALIALGLPSDYVKPGDRVVLKPNWVKEHDERKPGPNQWEHVVTHPAVIEAVIRWVAGRLQGRGSITVCDAPQTDSSFATLGGASQRASDRTRVGRSATLGPARQPLRRIVLDRIDRPTTRTFLHHQSPRPPSGQVRG